MIISIHIFVFAFTGYNSSLKGTYVDQYKLTEMIFYMEMKLFKLKK